MRDAQPAIERAGAELVLVGTGGPHFAKAFREEFAPGLRVLADPDLRSYTAVGFRRSLVALLSPKGLGPFVSALKNGFRQGKIMGDALQLGGTLVLRPGGEVAFAHASEHTFDRPEVSDVLAALR